jgi:hypothetical protein
MAYSRFVLPKTGSMTGPIILFTEFKENWQYFFTETNMVPDAPGDVDKVLTIKQHTVRRGPGDPAPYIRRSHERFFARTAKSKGSARPGKTYRIGEKVALGNGYVQLRQFAILGNDMDVLAYAKNKAKFEITVWSPNGCARCWRHRHHHTLMAWTLVGRATITGADLTVDVGEVTLPASGSLEVRVKQISPLETSLFRAGLIYVVTSTGGRELGVRKFWGHLEGEDVVLGSAGQVDVAGTGRLVIEPRAMNLKVAAHPSVGPWVLDVWVRDLPVQLGSATRVATAYADASTGTGLEFVMVRFP